MLVFKLLCTLIGLLFLGCMIAKAMLMFRLGYDFAGACYVGTAIIWSSLLLRVLVLRDE